MLHLYTHLICPFVYGYLCNSFQITISAKNSKCNYLNILKGFPFYENDELVNS